MAEQPGGDAPVQDSRSIEERVGAAFGNMMGFEKPKQQQQQARQSDPEAEQSAPEPEATDTPDGDQTPEPETFELDIDGEKYVLPKKLEKNFMQERDYTQKSQTVAQKERQIELLQEQARVMNMRMEFEKEVANEINQLRAYDAVLSEPIDLNSMSLDDAFKKKLQLDNWQKERDKIAQSLQVKHQQFSQKQQDAFAELQSKADQLIAKQIPNWNADTWKAVRDHARNEGYTDVELNSIHDPRHKATLWKAQQFDLLKSKASKTVVDVKGVKTTSSNPMPQKVKDKLAFNKAIQKTNPHSIERKHVVEAQVGRLFAKR